MDELRRHLWNTLVAAAEADEDLDGKVSPSIIIAVAGYIDSLEARAAHRYNRQTWLSGVRRVDDTRLADARKLAGLVLKYYADPWLFQDSDKKEIQRLAALLSDYKDYNRMMGEFFDKDRSVPHENITKYICPHCGIGNLPAPACPRCGCVFS